MASGQPSGAAQRWRQRRLRSWWRHEQQSIAAALAAATHHSAQQNGALRSQKTATRASEEAGSETYYAPRGPKTLPPGTRPEPLEEVSEPQGLSAAPRCPDAGAPLLSVPLLAGRDGIDDTTVRWLLKLELRARQREEEEEEEKKCKERAAETKRRAQALLDHAASLPKRKRKKRRKRRTPRTSSLPGRARRRHRQWFACSAGFTGDDVPRVMFPSGVVWPKMLRIMAGMVQKDSCSGMARLVLLLTVHLVLCFLPSLQARDAWHHGQYGPEGLVCWFFTMLLALCSLLCLQAQDARLHGRHGPQDSWSLTGAVLGQGFLHARCCATCGVLVQTVQYWQFRSCSSSRSSSLPVDTQSQIPMVLAVLMTISIPQLQLIDNAADVLVVHVGQVPQVQVVF